jgi:hypothetical protein
VYRRLPPAHSEGYAFVKRIDRLKFARRPRKSQRPPQPFRIGKVGAASERTATPLWVTGLRRFRLEADSQCLRFRRPSQLVDSPSPLNWVRSSA